MKIIWKLFHVLELKRDFDEHENGVSTWAFKHGKAAGCGTETLSSSKWFHIPLKVQEKNYGCFSIIFGYGHKQ